MTWKPTEGQLRAGDIICDLARDANANGWPIHYMIQARMQEVIAQALDQALADGAEKGAMDKVVGGGLLPTTPSNAAEYREMFPHDQRLNGHDPVVEAREEGPFANIPESDYSHLDMAVAANPALKALMQDTPFDAPKKRRGRPPGAKGKKAKVKAAKAKKETAPVAETVAATVTEPSEAPTQ